ncbi:MAG: YicC family protein [Candidatus Dadabacteria bacterium]|nr:YicC family protein [Candidatus Dadabacteria bacterium]NIQ16718.1 YicC family protein [Candidatus Dadabacteria bacterium]
MKSMTAFGESSINTKIGKVLIEIKSENHRFLDLKMQISEPLSSLETIATEMINNVIIRGKVRLKITLNENLNIKTSLRKDNFNENYKILNKIKNELGLKEEIKFEHILTLDDLFNTELKFDLSKTTKDKIVNCIKRALNKFNVNREIEGKKLSKDILSRIKNIKHILNNIKKKRKYFAKEASAKITERIENLLKDSQIDQTRVIQEVAFLTERSDISEEIVRLDAHISKFVDTSSEKGSLGKELDFLIQEMNRECGTISAKCKDADISHLTISLRSELEKIREQVQNIE